MKKRLLLLMLFTQFLAVQAADDQLLSSHAGDQEDTAQVSVEQYEQRTLVRYLRDEQEFPPFDANRIYKHTIMKEYIDSCNNPMFKVYAKDLFQDLTFDAIKVLIQVLGLTVEETRERLEHLELNDVAALYAKAVFWRIDNLATACVQPLAGHIEDVEIVGNDSLTQETEQRILQFADIKTVCSVLNKRLAYSSELSSINKKSKWNCWFSKVTYSNDGSKLVISMEEDKQQYGSVWRTFICDTLTNEVIELPIDMQRAKPKCICCSNDGQKVIFTQSSSGADCVVMLYDNINKSLKKMPRSFYSEIKSIGFTKDEQEIWILVDSGEVYKYHIVTGQCTSMYRSPFLKAVSGVNIKGGEYIVLREHGEEFVVENGRITYQTRCRLFLLNIATGEEKIIYDEKPNSNLDALAMVSASFNADKSKLLVQLGNDDPLISAVAIYNVVTGQLELTYYAPRVLCSAHYSQDETQLVLATRDTISAYDLQTDAVELLYETKDRCFDLVGYASTEFLVNSYTDIKFVPNITTAQLKELSFKQIQLLLKAEPLWQAGKPYILTGDEFEVYESLPAYLQKETLFDSFNACFDARECCDPFVSASLFI